MAIIFEELVMLFFYDISLTLWGIWRIWRHSQSNKKHHLQNKEKTM